ncbi:hypothetical protein MPDQ_007334 [Monascus purpureus]|uniref:Uncharacterized protein n=1 Tax=Monascus purpureus TaxID=5098 RepID=A0A507QUH3_MONPU|nr:hypothetical protein MPDQ_007334 [Monascus purpureus]BDD55754.1 hypothetical protein MAP00_001243 [Monascus purpureus]
MFAIRSPSTQPSSSDKEAAMNCFIPNILPCRIHHDGLVESVDRYWAPVHEKDNTQTAYFRGRKLRGRRVVLPEGYQGIVATPTDNVIPPSQGGKNGSTLEDEDAEAESVKILEKQATFDELMVWDHEIVPAADDHFVKGVEEWLKLAEAIHTTSSGDSEKKAST